jgi:signal recognition particle subunit SRP54
MKQLKDLNPPDQEVKRIEAIIRSMTLQERNNPKILNGSRRLRIANGSGTEVKDVNRLVDRFEQAQKMMSQFMKMGIGRGGKLPF